MQGYRQCNGYYCIDVLLGRIHLTDNLLFIRVGKNNVLLLLPFNQ